MQLKHSFTVPTGLEHAWEVLLDIERIAPCMPGAAIETVNGDDFTGTVKVRLGPIGLTYKGKASFLEKDATAHRAVIDAQGKDTRGNGTAKARITATLTEQGSDGTAVDVVTDLNITGKPAQFGRGVLVDVGNKLIGQFADCLAGKLSGAGTGGTTGSGGAELGSAGSGGAELGSAGSGGAELAGAGSGGAELAGAGSGGAARAGSPDPATVEWLATADLEGAEKLGIADPDTAEVGVSEPDADRAAVAAGRVESGVGSPAAQLQPADEQDLAAPSLADPGLADSDVVEAGLAGLRTPSVTADSSIAGPGLADAGAADPGAADPGAADAGAADAGAAAAGAETPADGAAVVAVPGPAPGETPIEPDAAAEAAPPAQRRDDAVTATGGTSAELRPPVAPSILAQPPAHRPAVADVEPIDLLASAGPAVAKRLAPLVAGVLLVLLVILGRRRRAASRSATRQARADYQAAVRRWAEAERRAAIARLHLSRTATAEPPRPAPDWRAWPALRSGGRPGGRARRRSG
jgi:carbon monoxide dehydrogenase subunit G